jgi:hypothetical protein
MREEAYLMQRYGSSFVAHRKTAYQNMPMFVTAQNLRSEVGI